MKPLSRSLLVAALSLAISSPARAQVVPASATSRGNLQEQIRKGLPGLPDNTVGHRLHYGLEILEGIEAGLTMAKVMHSLGAFALPLEIVGPVAGMAAVYVALGNAHADAINSVVTDQILSGFSRGVVLGADSRPESFVKYHFMKHAPVPNSVYPEYGVRFQNAYNRGLVAGYAQGKNLTKEESKALFLDLFSRMTVHPSVAYGEDSKAWSERTWVDYYVECGALFRRDHLK